VIAFGGKGEFSRIIKWATRGKVSHVGVILQRKMVGQNDLDASFFNELIESTTMNGLEGVSTSRLSDRVQSHSGELWWLPLSDQVREKLDLVKYFNFLFKQKGKKYDMPQAIGSGIDFMDRWHMLGWNEEDFSKFFCSELVAAGLEAGGAIPEVNSSEVTPIDICRWSIYREAIQLVGEPTEIKRFNTLDPGQWAAA
jgi:hypothetical protein